MPAGSDDFDKELEIQDDICSFLEQGKFGRILEERVVGRHPGLQAHQFLIMSELESAIERLNGHLWDGGAYREDKETIAGLIKADFVSLFDRARGNGEIHDLMFAPGRRNVVLTRHDGTVDSFAWYRVVDTDYSMDCRDNTVTVIREKVIRIRDRVQLPDFAIYLNGIPAFATEVKNPTRTSGIHAALEDYRRKESYHKFLACICTDGVNAGIVADVNSLSVDMWQAYGRHRNAARKADNGLHDLIEELVFSTRNLVAYLQFGLFPVRSADDVAPRLGCLRVQQYHVMKAAVQRIESCAHGEMFREVVKQPPRSGKTIAIRSIANVVTSRFPDAYDKIFIMVPDLTIMGQFYREFSQFRFANGFRVKRINSREKDEGVGDGDISYEEAVTEAGRSIYIMNMQKISDGMRTLSNPGCRALIFVDEVHTHQLGLNASVRDINLPDSSYITFTATPRKRIENGRPTDFTLMEYSTSEGFLDELLNADAKALNMVVPVVYEKAPYKVAFDEDNAKSLSDHVNRTIYERIGSDPAFRAVHEEAERRAQRLAASLRMKGVPEDEAIQKAEQRRDEYIDERANGFIRQVRDEFSRRLRVGKIPDLVDFIVRDLREKVRENYSIPNPEGQEEKPCFMPKAFLVVEDQEMANEVARHVAKVSGGTNAVGGLRFGLDYSEGMKFAGAGRSFIQDFNKFRYGDTIKDDFDSQGPDSTSVLIVVNKYLMGYDNKQLVAVYCYSSIKEPSRLFQLYTRPATKRPGKQLGFFVDMGFGEINQSTYAIAMDWFEGGVASTVLFLDDEQIQRRKHELWGLIDRLAGLLGLGRDDIVRRSNPHGLLVSLRDDDRKNQALDLCKSINAAVKNLLSPKYYGEFLGHVLAINKALAGLLNHMQANSARIVFTRKDVQMMLSEFLGVLRLSVEDIMDVELVEGRIVKTKGGGRASTEIDRKHHEAKRLMDTAGRFFGSDIFRRLQRMAEDIEMANQQEDDATRRAKVDGLLAEANDAVREMAEKVRSAFGGDLAWFITFKIMWNSFSAAGIQVSDSPDLFREFTRRGSTEIRKHVNASKVNGVLEVRDGTVTEVWRALTRLTAEFSAGDSALFQAIYERIAKVEDAERLIRDLLKEVHCKGNELRQHIEGAARA